jgi:Uncharacterized protein conserved in bacteria (DUF2334)
VRIGQQLLYKLGARYGERALAGWQLNRRFDSRFDGRRAQGPDEHVGPRVLVRVDEFPHYQAWDEPDRFGTAQFERFHRIMAAAGMPYLIAVLARVSRAPLSPAGANGRDGHGTGSRPLTEEEVAVLRRIAGERVCFALHGYTHRTRFASPRRHSELCGLDRAQTETLIDEALAELAGCGIRPDVFVPPFNRFDARQLEWLADRFAVVCGGPESIGLMGFQRTPQWRGGAVYLPSYAPYYGRAADLLKALPRAIESIRGLWMPIVLHWGWEAQDGWESLERLIELIAPYTVPWESVLAEVQTSRSAAPSTGSSPSAPTSADGGLT